jgi:cell division septation protein DedD
VSTGRQRISARDYKNARRSQPIFDFAKFRQFGAGLAVGLVLALFVWIHDRSAIQPAADDLTVAPGPDEVAGDPVAVSDADSGDAPADYAFYEMLPNFEVEVPDRSHAARRDQAIAAVVTPGAYVLQAGAYRETSGAEVQRDKLAKLDIEATILHVSDDRSELHVVRIGPLRDLNRVNAIQKTLHAADIDFYLQRVGD